MEEYVSSPESENPPSQRIALVIGVNGPEQADFLAPLQHAEQDAADLVQVLRRVECGFKVHTLSGEQATAGAIQDAFFDLCNQFTDNDLLLLYFNGHAEPLTVRDGSSDIFFATCDYHPDKARRNPARFFSLHWLYQELADTDSAGDILVILDCCYAGNAVSAGYDLLQLDIRSLIKRYDENQSITSEQHKTRLRVILTGTGYNEKAFEHRSLTRLLLPALRGEVRDARDSSGNVVLQTLHNHIQRELPTSYLVNDITRRCVLARYAHLSDEAIQQRNREEREDAQAERRHQRLQAMLPDHTGFLRDRLESFVGRAKELAEIRQRIAEKLPTGGYVTITGQAGQGKSSIIAKLVDEYDIENVAYHFIPFNPGPDHQISLLRNLMAHLILKHNLSDIYVASESRPALRDFFPKVLRDVTTKGMQEVIFLDGIDQLEPEQSGERDLSFLPADVPAGVVFVLGTRPNDTLKPLELLKPHDEYPLPNMSRDDFDLILQHRHVTLESNLAESFYKAMEANALYLDLAAKELAAANYLDPEVIIRQIADNPENIFSLAIDRLRRNWQQWSEAIRPILGILLAAQEPLSLRSIRSILGIDGDTLREALQRLGGLVAKNNQGCYFLFHLKFQEFLRQDNQRPDKRCIFDADEEERLHVQLADWCEDSKGGLMAIWQDVKGAEQERRQYARQHYVIHLYRAKQWERLFAVLDVNKYAKAKLQYDPSTRSYARDLELGQKAASDEGLSFREGLHHLPRLWRYIILRCSLASRAKHYPDELFTMLVLMQREREAIELVDFLPRPEHRAMALRRIGEALACKSGRNQEAHAVLKRAEAIVYTINDKWDRARVRYGIIDAMARAEQWDEAVNLAYSMDDARDRVEALAMIVEILATIGEKDRLISLLSKVKTLSKFIGYNWEYVLIFEMITDALNGIRSWNEVTAELWKTKDVKQRTKNFTVLAKALAGARHHDKAAAVIYMLEDNLARQNILIAVSRSFISLKEYNLATPLLNDAIYAANTIENKKERSDILVSIALALAEIGNPEASVRLLGKLAHATYAIDDAKDQTAALIAFAEGIAEMGERIIAVNVLEEAGKKAENIVSLQKVADAMVRLGEESVAMNLYYKAGYAPIVSPGSENLERTIKKLKHEGKQREAFLLFYELTRKDEYLENLVKKGEWQEAIDSVRTFRSDSIRVMKSLTVIKALIDLNKKRLANQIFDTLINEKQDIKDIKEREIAFTSVAEVAVRLNRIEIAIQFAGEITTLAQDLQLLWEKLTVLLSAARILTKVRRQAESLSLIEESLRLVTEIEDLSHRADVLKKVAITLAQAGEQERLLRLTQQYWSQATTRDEAFRLFPIVSGLIAHDTEAVSGFTSSFTWVDDFLKQI